jgi:hypothetical protein
MDGDATTFAMPNRSASSLLASERDEPVEPAVDPMTNKPNPKVGLAADDASLEQVQINYNSSRRDVLIVIFIHLAITVAGILAFIYYSGSYDYYGYASINTAFPPPGVACNTGFPIWKRFIMGIIIMLAILLGPYLLWTINERPRANIRLQIYTTFVEWMYLVVYVLLAVALILSIFWCNGPLTFFNWCNDRNWDCAYAPLSETLCHDCPLRGMPMLPLLTFNPSFLVFFTFGMASFILYIITMIVMGTYSTSKLQFATHALKDPLRSRKKLHRELAALAVGIIILAFAYMAVIVGSILYLFYYSPASDMPTKYSYEMPAINPPGSLYDYSFSTKWVLYFAWALTSIILPIVTAYSIYPTTNGRYKINASYVAGIWLVKDIITLFVMLILFAVCNVGIIPGNPCSNSSDPTIASPLFRVIAIAVAIQFVLDILILALFMIMRRLIVRLIRLDGDIRQHIVFNERTVENTAPDFEMLAAPPVPLGTPPIKGPMSTGLTADGSIRLRFDTKSGQYYFSAKGQKN